MRTIPNDWNLSVGEMFRLNGGAANFLNVLMAEYNLPLEDATAIYRWLCDSTGQYPKPAVLQTQK